MHIRSNQAAIIRSCMRNKAKNAKIIGGERAICLVLQCNYGHSKHFMHLIHCREDVKLPCRPSGPRSKIQMHATEPLQVRSDLVEKVIKMPQPLTMRGYPYPSLCPTPINGSQTASP